MILGIVKMRVEFDKMPANWRLPALVAAGAVFVLSSVAWPARAQSGLLPPDHYALAERIAGGLGPDVLILQCHGNGVALPKTPGCSLALADAPAGTLVTASLCAANRDPALGGGDLEQLDLTRAPLPHVAFGYGIHHCLGAPLARIELRIAFSALLRRLPGLALAVDPSAVRYRQDNLIHGVEALPVTW